MYVQINIYENIYVRIDKYTREYICVRTLLFVTENVKVKEKKTFPTFCSYETTIILKNQTMCRVFSNSVTEEGIEYYIVLYIGWDTVRKYKGEKNLFS